MESLIDAKWLIAPWQIQVALGSGYAAYMAAYTGVRNHHQAVDTTFRAIAFGLVATLVLMIIPASRPVLSIGGAFVATVIVGLLWRRFGMSLWEGALRNLNVSWGDDTPTAWMRTIADQRHYITQVAVQTSDGTWLRCDDAQRFNGAPGGPCTLGTTGDILLYVTKIRDVNGERDFDAEDANYGFQAAYVPAGQIRQINIRRRPIKS
ncbi:MAG TPA: hypothetical protein VF695_03700 [Sphingomonas sp.]|jgi:hypothetical protein